MDISTQLQHAATEPCSRPVLQQAAGVHSRFGSVSVCTIGLDLVVGAGQDSSRTDYRVVAPDAHHSISCRWCRDSTLGGIDFRPGYV
eukprot:305793-Rhodomonas_salina.1